MSITGFFCFCLAQTDILHLHVLFDRCSACWDGNLLHRAPHDPVENGEISVCALEPSLICLLCSKKRPLEVRCQPPDKTSLHTRTLPHPLGHNRRRDEEQKTKTSAAISHRRNANIKLLSWKRYKWLISMGPLQSKQAFCLFASAFVLLVALKGYI